MKKIIKILSWSLSNIPRDSITENTLVLVPNLDSSYFIDFSLKNNIDVQNVKISYNMCKSANIRLFDQEITETIIFYNNGDCVVLSESGDFAEALTIKRTDKDFLEKESIFCNLWNISIIL